MYERTIMYLSINKLRPCFRNACRYRDNIFEDSALLAALTTKAALNDSKLNINGAALHKEIKLHNYCISSIIEPYLIADKDRCLSPDVEECFLKSLSLNIEKTINGLTTLNMRDKIPSDSILRSNLFGQN